MANSECMKVMGEICKSLTDETLDKCDLVNDEKGVRQGDIFMPRVLCIHINTQYFTQTQERC